MSINKKLPFVPFNKAIKITPGVCNYRSIHLSLSFLMHAAKDWPSNILHMGLQNVFSAFFGGVYYGLSSLNLLHNKLEMYLSLEINKLTYLQLAMGPEIGMNTTAIWQISVVIRLQTDWTTVISRRKKIIQREGCRPPGNGDCRVTWQQCCAPQCLVCEEVVCTSSSGH